MHTTSERPSFAICDAMVRQDRRVEGPFAVTSLSASSLTLQGNRPRSALGGRAIVALTMPDGNMLHLEGRITASESCDSRCVRITMQLQNLNPYVEDRIQEIVTKSLERSRLPIIVALDRGRLEALDIQRSLHALGRQVVFAHDGMDAVWILEEFHDLYSTILIDQSFIEASGSEILPFLHDRYGDKRRVLVIPGSRDIMDAMTPVVWSVHGVLINPWTAVHLQSALGLFPGMHTIRSKRILFVDDEPSVLTGLQHRLHRDLRQHETVWVTSGEVALSESRARPFDVVVADLRMPGMDGVSLLRAIKDHSPRSKRIVLSGYDTREANDVADVVLHKPCPPSSLRTEVLGPA